MQTMIESHPVSMLSNFGFGVGLLITSGVALLFWIFLLYFVGVIGKKFVVIPGDLLEEDRVNGVRKFSEKVVKDSPMAIMYKNCSEEFQCFLWLLITVFVPAIILASLLFGSINLVNAIWK